MSLENEFISEKRSMRGYSFATAVKRNKEAIKIFLALIGGLNIIPPFDGSFLLFSVVAGVLALAVKIAADAVDFYSNEVELK